MAQARWVFSKAFLNKDKAAAHLGELAIQGYVTKFEMAGEKKIYVYRSSHTRGEMREMGLFGKPKKKAVRRSAR